MSTRVLKYRLDYPFPRRHKFLHADFQEGAIAIWVEVPDNVKDEWVTLPYRIIPTGLEEIKPGWVHKATVINPFNKNVWHIYDTRDQRERLLWGQ